MPRTLHFTSDFDYRPSDDLRTIYGYLAGTIHDVCDECAEWALFSKCAVEVLYDDEYPNDDDLNDWDAE